MPKMNSVSSKETLKEIFAKSSSKNSASAPSGGTGKASVSVPETLKRY